MLKLWPRRAEPARPTRVAGWHPDFRDVRKLPDVRVVRTSFFINGLLAFAAATLAGAAGFREWQLHDLRGRIADAEAVVARDRAGSEQALAVYRRFQEDDHRLAEVAAFLDARPLVSPLLLRLGETLPADVALDGLELREDGLALRLSVRGDALVASGRASRYLDVLRGEPLLAGFDQFGFAGTPVRHPSTGQVGVEFWLRLRPPPASAAGKAGVPKS